jgi:hypothetical protein
LNYIPLFSSPHIKHKAIFVSDTENVATAVPVRTAFTKATTKIAIFYFILFLFFGGGLKGFG